jgi:ribosomal protein L37AE/L43A
MKDLTNAELGNLINSWGRDLAKHGLFDEPYCPICHKLEWNKFSQNIKVCKHCQGELLGSCQSEVFIKAVANLCNN